MPFYRGLFASPPMPASPAPPPLGASGTPFFLPFNPPPPCAHSLAPDIAPCIAPRLVLAPARSPAIWITTLLKRVANSARMRKHTRFIRLIGKMTPLFGALVGPFQS